MRGASEQEAPTTHTCTAIKLNIKIFRIRVFLFRITYHRRVLRREGQGCGRPMANQSSESVEPKRLNLGRKGQKWGSNQENIDGHHFLAKIQIRL